MNKKLRIMLIAFVVLGTGVLMYTHFGTHDAPAPANAELVNAAATSSRAMQQQAPPNDDIPRQGKARAGAMGTSGSGP